MKEQLETWEGQQASATLEGYRYKANFYATRHAGIQYDDKADCYSEPRKYQVFWWEGQGEIIDRNTGKQHWFLLRTEERCTCCFREEKGYVHDLAGSVFYFKESGVTKVTPRPNLVDERQIIDLALKKLVDQIEEFESKTPEERKGLIPTLTPQALEINDLVEGGLVFDSQEQRHMVFA